MSVGGITREKILVSRSGFISSKSLADGTATKGERLLFHGLKLLFFFFSLLFLFAGLSMLPSQPVTGAAFAIFAIIFFSKAALIMRIGRKDAVRKPRKKGMATR